MKARMPRARMSREKYYLEVLEAVRKRSTCDRGKSGAIIVKEGRVITTGYVGAPTGCGHCDEVGHLIEFHSPEESEKSPCVEKTKHCIRTVHAELNAILQAAYFGVSIKFATMYCTMVPCFSCGQAIVNVRMARVIAVHPYQTQERTVELFDHCGVELAILKQDNKLYNPEKEL